MTNYTMKDLPFSLQWKNYGTNSELIHYYQINYNNSCVCLTTKEKSISFFFILTHTKYLSQIRQHFALSSLFSSSHIALFWLSYFFLSNSLLWPLSLFSCAASSFSIFNSICGTPQNHKNLAANHNPNISQIRSLSNH